jgi:hypothetical protein
VSRPQDDFKPASGSATDDLPFWFQQYDSNEQTL